jgi:tetratricopeptide (TPR) repeat protein
LLSYVDREVRSAVHSLSACRAFDEELYIKLGSGCHFQASSANFEILTSFSFVWKESQRGEKWYRIHDLLRRLDSDRDNQKTRRVHEFLERYYRELGNAAEAIYHANRLDWQRGAKEWGKVFEEALELSRYGECESLLAVRSELWIKSDFRLGIISQLEGDYYAHLARYAEAKQEYLEAVTACDRQIIITPDDEATLNNKGIALGCLGKLQAELREFEAAKQFYLDAIAPFNSALEIAPKEIAALNNKGNALRCLGDLQAGNALQCLDELQAQLEFEAAKQFYLDAIAAFNSALGIAANDIAALNNKGIALQSLGDLQAGLSKFEAAKQFYLDAIAAFNSALEIAPDDHIAALKNKGLTLKSLGKLQAWLSESEDAKQSYSEAIAALNSALGIAANDIAALNNKGIALGCLGDLQAGISEFEAAKLSYSKAIAAYNSTLEIAPDDIYVLNNKGLAVKSMGDLQAKLSNQQEALKNWQEALEMWNRSLAIAPNDDRLRSLRDALQQLLNNFGDDTVSS